MSFLIVLIIYFLLDSSIFSRDVRQSFILLTERKYKIIAEPEYGSHAEF